ncbi:MAG: LysM peptidoglycan-binding domain-containing protein [bacterium]|nr:LysM peptidoglycan-binding domain-containing protein [bacterium]
MALKGVVLDSGHGGNDQGSSGNGIIEKEFTLKISQYMYDRFKALGVPVKMTRTSDVDLEPNDRPGVVLDKFGNGKDVVVISNHINAGGGEGAEVIYALRNSDKLASSILNELEKSGQVVRKYYQRRLPSDSSKDYYYIIRNTPNNETLIVEYGFLDNAADAERLKNNYKKYAEAVVRAVTLYGGYKYVPVSGSNYYVVKKGDSLWSIARANGLTVDELKSLNNLSSNVLHVGDTLLISGADSTGDDGNDTYYVVKGGDTLWSIARKYNLSVNELKSLNNLSGNVLSIGQRLIVGKESSNDYIVSAGDTLWAIARKFNVSVDEIKSLNNLSSNNLSIGMTLKIPPYSNKKNEETNVYVVKSGDSLWSIARMFNSTVDEIKSLNGLKSNVLSIGQRLVVPS